MHTKCSTHPSTLHLSLHCRNFVHKNSTRVHSQRTATPACKNPKQLDMTLHRQNDYIVNEKTEQPYFVTSCFDAPANSMLHDDATRFTMIMNPADGFCTADFPTKSSTGNAQQTDDNCHCMDSKPRSYCHKAQNQCQLHHAAHCCPWAGV